MYGITAAVVLTAYLGLASMIDIAKKRLPVWVLAAGTVPAVIGTAASVLNAPEGERIKVLISHALGMLIGLSFLIICLITREKLGKGDAIIFAVCGAAVGHEKLLTLILSAFLLSALYGVAMLAIGRMTRKSSFAFVPFILLGNIMTEVLMYGA